MQAIVPISLGTSNVTNDIPITETLWTAGTYTLGTQRYKDIWLYEVIADPSTTKEPGVAGSQTDWKLVGAINKYKMIDNRANSVSTKTTSMSISITCPSILESLALLNIQGISVRVKIDTIETVPVNIFDRTIQLQDYSEVFDWWDYFYGTSSEKNEVLITDIPPYANVTVSIEISGPVCSLGEVSLGKLFDLGWTQFESSCSILDYSRKEVSDTGDTVLVQGVFVKKIDYSIQIPRAKTSSIYKFLSQYRATPLVWIGEVEREELSVFGFYRDFNIILSNPAVDLCSLNVEGL
jgi:hypothetical protein